MYTPHQMAMPDKYVDRINPRWQARRTGSRPGGPRPVRLAERPALGVQFAQLPDVVDSLPAGACRCVCVCVCLRARAPISSVLCVCVLMRASLVCGIHRHTLTHTHSDIFGDPIITSESSIR